MANFKSSTISEQKTTTIYEGGASGIFLSDVLTKSNPIGKWHYIPYKQALLHIAFPSKLSDGSSAVFNGSIKLQTLFGKDTSREYAICDVVGNSVSLSEVFYFNNSHLGKSGMECDLPGNGYFRFVLEPSGDDEVLVEYNF